MRTGVALYYISTTILNVYYYVLFNIIIYIKKDKVSCSQLVLVSYMYLYTSTASLST